MTFEHNATTQQLVAQDKSDAMSSAEDSCSHRPALDGKHGEPLFTNTWRDAATTGRREKAYTGTLVPSLHGAPTTARTLVETNVVFARACAQERRSHVAVSGVCVCVCVCKCVQTNRAC